MNDVDDLDDLERELGPSLRVALRRTAAEITDDGSTTSPWASDHDPVSRPLEEGVTVVDLETRSWGEPAPERRRPRLVAAIILAAAAVVVAIAVVAVSRRDDAKPADRPVGAIAEAFMEAWVRGDGDAVAASISPDGFVDAWTPETLPALHDWYRAVGWQYQDDGCEVMSPERVLCNYSAQNDLTRAFGSGPLAGSFVLDIDGGGTVESAIGDFNIAAYKDIWDGFINWVREHHPDDFDRMYTTAASYARVDPISIGLWERHTGEFVESGGAYIARARAICTAAHERYDGLEAASAQSGVVDSEAAAGILEDALVELRVLPSPAVVQERFDLGYTLVEQLVDSLRGLAAAGPAPVTTGNAPPSPADGDLTVLLNNIAHLQLGLERCAFNPLR